MKDFHEGASATRVPPNDTEPADCPRCEGRRVLYDEEGVDCDECGGTGNAPETRECEGCGQQKPIEEMSTVLLPGTGETFQCEQCRGVTP